MSETPKQRVKRLGSIVKDSIAEMREIVQSVRPNILQDLKKERPRFFNLQEEQQPQKVKERVVYVDETGNPIRVQESTPSPSPSPVRQTPSPPSYQQRPFQPMVRERFQSGQFLKAVQEGPIRKGIGDVLQSISSRVRGVQPQQTRQPQHLQQPRPEPREQTKKQDIAFEINDTKSGETKKLRTGINIAE